MINPKQLATEVAIIIFAGYAFYSTCYLMLDIFISFLIFIFTGDLKSYLSDGFDAISMNCDALPFCMQNWQMKTSMLGLNSIFNSIISAQYSFGGRLGSSVIAVLISSMVMPICLKQKFEFFENPSRVEKVLHFTAFLLIIALFIPTMVASFIGFWHGVIKIFIWR